MSLSPNYFDFQEPVLEAKDLVVTLEKRTISHLSVSARISRGGSRIFSGGGALVSCSTSTPINHIVFFFAEY